jgi:acyl-[acyl-carrier-protein]-phospholipid O-acyltransferase/long-chain-fatty-acid--[acyl-carrier-protein] ligase
MFAIPLQVFLQTRPPNGQKGRMIAVMNQANFAAILLSAGLYWLFDRIVIWLDWNRSPIFAMTALVMLPIALFYRGEPQTATEGPRPTTTADEPSEDEGLDGYQKHQRARQP